MNKNTKRRLFGCPAAKIKGLRRERMEAAEGRTGSESAGKNMRQVVLVNVGEDGSKVSKTVYEPAVKGKPVYTREFPRGRKEAE